jgi:pilus assembly protein Flp/PilA
MRERCKNFLIDESGGVAVEYGLMAAIIAIGILSSVEGFADSLFGLYEAVATATTNAS